MSLLDIRNLSVSMGQTEIISNINFSLDYGQNFMIIGPNGAGKSTLIKAIAKICPYKGTISINNINISKMKHNDFAKKIGVLLQSNISYYDFSVRELVSLGRYAYKSNYFSSLKNGHFSGLNKAGAAIENSKKIALRNEELIDEAISIVGLTKIQDRSTSNLSGGELQRAFLAQVFAQDPQILLLDEPANHLDLVYQKQTFSLLNEWLTTKNRSIVCVMHDISIAKAFGTHGIVLNNGKQEACGTIDKCFSKKTLDNVYRMDVSNWINTLYDAW